MRYTLSACILTFMLLGCTKEKADSYQYERAPIIKVNGQDSGQANTTIPIPVTYSFRDGSHGRGYFESSGEGHILIIQAMAKFTGGATMATANIPDTFSFRPASPGIYYLICDGMGRYLVDTVIVR